jgi:hypothetical protein
MGARITDPDDNPKVDADAALLRRLITGALVSTIHAHGPIDHAGIPSAAKRILGALKQYAKMKNTKK